MQLQKKYHKCIKDKRVLELNNFHHNHKIPKLQALTEQEHSSRRILDK